MSKTKITLKENDALTMLSASTKKSIKEIDENVIRYLKSKNEFIDSEIWGLSIKDVLEIEEIETNEFIKILFIETSDNPEIKEVLESVYFVGLGNCDECGGNMVEEIDGDFHKSWSNYKCDNCDNEKINEPYL